MSKRPPPNEEGTNKRTKHDTPYDEMKKAVDDLFLIYDGIFLHKIQYLKDLLQNPENVKEARKEYSTHLKFIVAMTEAKRFEYSRKYQDSLGACADDANYFNNLSFLEKETIIRRLEDIKKNDSKKPYIIQIFESNMPDKFKLVCLNKVGQLKHDHNQKMTTWIDACLKLPFQNTTNLPVSLSDGLERCQAYMRECEKILNECVYGMTDAKKQLMQLVGKWITNPNSIGTAIGLKGPMGVGKTTLVKKGISKLLNRHFAFISLGGAMDGATLKGHSYTYEGGTYGKIADILIQSRTNNPIIFFDELDKVSQTDKGQEIVGVLTHLTDTTQNDQFHDDYFSEIDLDLSKALIICSYNDESMINPILKDRMYTIDIPGYSTSDKICISKTHLIPEIEKDIGLSPGLFTIKDTTLKYLIDKTKNEDGVRNLKRNLETIYSKLNLFRILKETTIFNDMIEVTTPFEINELVINSLIKISIPKHNPMYI
jgi:ATP-dependent Lon protease